MADRELDKTINKGIQTAKAALADKMVQMANKDAEEAKQETVYNVVFTGVFTKDEKMVVAAMAKFFKQGHEATKRLLKVGRVVKSYDNKMAAEKLVKMLNGIGLSCKIEFEDFAGAKDQTLLQKAATKLDETDMPLVRVPKFSEISWKQWLILLLIVIGASGAGAWMYLKPLVVTGNSFITYEASVEKVISHAPEEERAALKTAVDFLTGAEFEYRQRNTSGGNEQVAANMAYGRISGMNAKEIIAAAQLALEVKRKGYREEIERLTKEITEANAEIAQLDSSNTELHKIILSDVRFAWGNTDVPEMDLKVTNGSGETLARLYFQGYLYDAKGKLLVTDAFSFGTAFGVKPNNTKYAGLYTKVGDVWSAPEIKAQGQAVTFKVTLENAENMNGRMLGVDLRPARKKAAATEAQISKLQQELLKIKL